MKNYKSNVKSSNDELDSLSEQEQMQIIGGDSGDPPPDPPPDPDPDDDPPTPPPG